MAFSSLLCPLEGCEFVTRQEKRLLEHLSSFHGLDPEQAYVEHVRGGQPGLCECGCGEGATWLGWKRGYGKFLRGHNARVLTPFSDPATAQKCVAARVEGYRKGRHRPWNSGLTAETDGRVAASGARAGATLRQRYASGELSPWQAGLTAETDPRLRRLADTKAAQYASGEARSWNEGLTKDTSPSLARAGQKISQAYDRRLAGRRLNPQVVEGRVSSAGFDLLDDDYRSRKGSRFRVRCRACGGAQERTLYSIEETGKCFLCSPRETAGHLELLEFVRSLAPDALSNDRTVISPLELDIVIPSARLAVEFNGLCWHSEAHRGRTYHSDKTRMSAAAGYRLLHVWEDEWRNRRPIIESMVRHRLGCDARRVGARECEVVRPTLEERRNFFDRCHIDGDTPASEAWALSLRGELLACLSVRRPGHRKWADRLEVARFAVASGCSVPGALSRLSRQALKRAAADGHQGLMSYVDTRYGDGAGYLRAGYIQHSRTGPTFWWSDFSQRFNRFRYRADPTRGLTEAQVASAGGVSKVWGCDQLVMTLG